MAISTDLDAFPHTTPNDQPPAPGDLVLGPEGLLAVCYVGSVVCVGLIVIEDDYGVVDIPLDEYRESFPTRILVAESVRPEGLVQ